MNLLTKSPSSLLLFFLLFAACSSELDVFPEDAITPAELSEGDIPTIKNGVLENLKDAFIPFYVLDFDGYGENFQYPNGPAPLQVVTPEDGNLLDIWSGLYSAIFNANVLIQTASGYEGPVIEEALATGYFVRAYSYYNLVTRFGGVPLLEENTNDPIPRATEEETWSFIVSDLNKALSFAPELSNPLFVSKQAVQAILARVYLSTGENSLAAQLAQEVIGSGYFSFESNYESIFLEDGGDELIFGLSNFEGDLEIWRGANATSFNPPGGAGFTPAQELFDNLFDEGDPRKEATFIEFNGQLMLNKYSTNQTIPVLVSRLSEMHLIRAEALGLNGGGLSALNALRDARGLSLLSPLSEESFQAAVALERRREFYGEGFLFYDLVRTGKAVEQLQFVNNINQTRLPIPQQEIDLGNLEQNPGY